MLPARAMRGTSYATALEAAMELFKLQPSMPSHVLLLSDGRPADPKKALELLQTKFLCDEYARMRVHGIGFGSSETGFAPLQQLVSLSDGIFCLSGSSCPDLQVAFSTISSTITSTASKKTERGDESFQQVLPKPRLVHFEQPELWDFGRKNVLRFPAACKVFHYDGGSDQEGGSKFDATGFYEQLFPLREVARRSRPHMKGSMRLVYGFLDHQFDTKQVSSKMVAKISRHMDDNLNSLAVVETYAKSSAVAHFFAEQFNQRIAAAAQNKRATFISDKTNISFAPCFIYEVMKKGVLSMDVNYFTAEPFLAGPFLKYNSNAGFICGDSLPNYEVVQAFTHFTFVESKGTLLVADLQGVPCGSRMVLTDPQVLSLEGMFGPGDLGAGGMCACLRAHRCGKVCRQLGMSPVFNSVLRSLDGPPQSALRMQNSESASTLPSEWERVLGDRHTGSDKNVSSTQSSLSSWIHVGK